MVKTNETNTQNRSSLNTTKDANGLIDSKQTRKVSHSKKRVSESKCFDVLIWAIQGPIIVMPGYEDMAIPDNVKNRIQIERLVLAARQEHMASEAETMWYISTASLRAPIGRDWTDIYMYLTRKYAQTLSKDVPNFLKDPIELNELQELDMKHLRQWLFKKSIEARKQKYIS